MQLKGFLYDLKCNKKFVGSLENFRKAVKQQCSDGCGEEMLVEVESEELVEEPEVESVVGFLSSDDVESRFFSSRSK